MITSELNGFPLFITENCVGSYEITVTSMSYYIDIMRKEDRLVIKGECENIPCGTCPLSTLCKNGKNVTLALTDYVKSHHPELLI